MKIQIISQTNEKECGVCALTSLHNYFYSDDRLDKSQVLDKGQIQETGMTIFDLEVLANKLGLECESYEVNWSEFLNLKLNGYFVLLLNTNLSNNHYVIAKKMKKGVEIYDSCSNKPKFLKYEELKNLFLNVVILVSKKPGKLFSKTFGKAKTLLLFDSKFVLLNLLLSLLILLTSMGAASFLNWIIDLAISKSSINNLLTIGFVFILIYFLNDLLIYISGLYTSTQTKAYLLLFSNKILSSIEKKTNNFLNKVDKDWMYKIDECIYNISNFCVVSVNRFITNAIFCFICICVIGSINPWMLFFCLFFFVVEFVYLIFQYKKKKELFLTIVRQENRNVIYYRELSKHLTNCLWQTKTTRLINKIKINYSSIYKNFNDVTIFRNFSNLVVSLVRGIIEIGLIVVASYLIITTKTLSIGAMTFLVASFSLYKTSLSEIGNYFLSKLEFDVYWQVYKDITNVENLSETTPALIDEEIKSLTFIFNNNKVRFISNKANNIKQLSCFDLLNKSSSIFINESLVSLQQKAIKDKFILVNDSTKMNSDETLELFEKHFKVLGQYVRYFGLDLTKTSQNLSESIVINLLCLMTEKEKIILIENVLEYTNKKDKLVIKEVLNKIRKNNAVFIVGKEEND